MRKLLVPATFAALPLLAAPAFASSFAGSSAGTSAGGTSASSGSTSGDDKIMMQARDDAACFVASDGAIRGAMLEAALASLRERHPGLRERSDLALAQAILAQ
jgi:uncharacterized protein (TIGR02448 family)